MSSHKAIYDAEVKAPFDALSDLIAFNLAAWLSAAAAARHITDVWRTAAPMNEWLAEHVGRTG